MSYQILILSHRHLNNLQLYYNHYMYIGTEASQGIQVVDIEDPENAQLVYTWTEVSNSHNIHVHDG